MSLESLDRIAFAAVAITAHALHEVAGVELTFLGWRVVVVLGEGDAPLRVGDVAGRLGLSPQSASKLLRRLERRGIVALGQDPNDRRGVLVSLAPEGRRIREGVLERRRAALGDALAEPVPDAFGPGIETVAQRLERWI